jgi:glycosyltransferase involved in cell wall biosynthesis
VKRRILHVCESTAGGIGVFLFGLARHQVEAGADVALAVPSGGPLLSELERSGVRHYAWEAVAQPGPAVPRELARLRAIVADFDPDVVHLHSSKAGLVGRLLLRGRRPTVMQPHAWSYFAKTGPVRALTLRWERLAARWAHVVVCVSESERSAGTKERVRADYRVLPNGVELARFPPPEPAARARARRLLGLGDEPLAVCVGRLHRQKNQAALLDVWPEVRAAVPGARLVLLGDGPDRESLELSAVDGVEIAGAVDDVRPWLAAATLVVQPSRWEGMSLSVLEAMASGRGVVVTAVPGMSELVAGGAGEIVPPGDRQALVQAIVRRLASPELADAEGRSGRRRVEERHDVRRQRAGIDAIYDELLAPPLRVLVLQPYAELGGSENWLLRLLEAAPQLDATVILLKDGPFRARLEQRGIRVELHPVGASPAELARAVAWLARRLRDDPPDVVLGNVVKAQLVAAPAGLLTGVPTVWARHDHGYERTLALPLGKLSDRVVAPVEELAAAARRNDAVIIPPPRSGTEPAAREVARAHLAGLGIDFPDAPTLAMAGRLVPFKGVDDAIRALALPAAGDWRLVVAGEDDHSAQGETARLRALALELGVEERVQFAGHVTDIAHWLAAFDALAVLTRPGARRAPRREGFGTAAFEAMLAGVPVIAVVGGAVSRRLEGRAGIEVPPGDPGAVAEALGRLADPRARLAAGSAAREIAASHPKVEECARLLVEVLHEAARGRGRRAQRRRATTSA